MYALLCLWLCASSAFALPHARSGRLLRRQAATHTQHRLSHRVAGRPPGKSKLVVKPGYIFASLHGSEHRRPVGNNPPDASKFKTNSTKLAGGIPQSRDDAESDTANESQAVFSETKHARQLSGPFTLLDALTRCAENEHLQQVLHKARIKGVLDIHIIGVDVSLEPTMAWAGVLGGWDLKGKRAKTQQPDVQLAMAKLAAEALPIKEEWQLEHAFSNVKLHLLFNGFEDPVHRSKQGIFKGKCREAAYASGAMAGRDDFVRIQCLAGKYASKSVNGMARHLPDLAVALNPGFGTEPAEWEESIKFLLDNNVTTLVTSGISNKENSLLHSANMLRAQLPRPENETDLNRCQGPTGVDMSSMSDARVLQRLGANIVAGYQNPFAYPSEDFHHTVKNGEALLFIGRTNESKIGSPNLAQSPRLDRQALIRDELAGMLSECKDHLDTSEKKRSISAHKVKNPQTEYCFRDALTRINATKEFTCHSSDFCKYGRIVPLFRNFIKTVPCLLDCQDYLNSLPHYLMDE